MIRPPCIRTLAVAVLAVSCAHARDSRPTRDWISTTPASVGLDPGPLAELDAEIAGGAFGYVDGVVVVRRGELAWERSYAHDYDEMARQAPRDIGAALGLHDPSGPYNYLNPWWHPFLRRGDLHTMQSVTKTVTSVTIGVALARGGFPDLDTPVLSFFDEAEVANVDERKRRVTIRDLLTMTPGFEWREDVPFAPGNSAHAMEASHDWVRHVIDMPMRHEPGTVFHYSSGATQLLAHVFRRATGQDVEEYAARHLFAPLGIERFYWKRTPRGAVNTEGGLYLRPRDLAKIGLLFLRNGAWEGRQLVDPEWVKASTAPAATVSEASGFKYGYSWWLVPHGEDASLAWAAFGWGGQMMFVVPERDLVLVFTGWNILEQPNRLRARVALERVLRAVVD